MAVRERVKIDGKDLHEFGIDVISYQEDGLMAAPKDGGGLDVEGIDGIIPTNSSIMSNLTGTLEIKIEGNTELDVLDTLRNFKQFIRDGDFRQISVDNNLGFYRLGKIVQISDYKIYEIPNESSAIGFFTFKILYQNGYEYAINSIDLNFDIRTASEITSPVFTFNNTGAPNRDAVLTIEPLDVDLVGRLVVTCYTEDKEGLKYVNELVVGKEGQILASITESLVIDFGEPIIELVRHVDGKREPKMSKYTSGQFFTIPKGRIRLTVSSLNSAGTPQVSLNARASIVFIPKYN